MRNDLYTTTFHCFGGPNELQLALDPSRGHEVAQRLIAEAQRIEWKYSRYRPDSIVSRINAGAGSEAVAVDEETAALLDYASRCYEQSGGLFDITSGVLRRAWNFSNPHLPSPQQLEELLPLIGWDSVRWTKGRVLLPRHGMEIDFGGFGKEYAADRLRALALELGVPQHLINLGGDVAVSGGQPSGLAWQIGITHPRHSGVPMAVLPLRSGGVATSGDYERYFDLDGVRYCHILNPRTGWPVRGFQSVSVVAESCLVAGSLSTIAMLKGEREGLAFLRATGVPYLVVQSNGEQRTGGGARVGRPADSNVA